MKRIAILATNGIRSDPEAVEWTDWIVADAQYLSNNERQIIAQSYEHDEFAITKGYELEQHISAFLEIDALHSSRADDVIWVGHSHGGEILIEALRRVTHYIKHIHFINSAAERDFADNGLNLALASGKLGGCTLWFAGKDVPLQVANKTRIPAKGLQLLWRILSLGLYVPSIAFGDMGRLTGENDLTKSHGVAKDVLNKVKIIVEETFGHSTNFEPDKWSNTLQRIMKCLD